MQFLYPIGLAALASLLVPIIIHLWQIKKGKTLKIGSVSLMAENSASNSRSIQISDWLLLLLRCLFFALLVLLLTLPYLKGKTKSKSRAGWVLLDQHNLKDTYLSNQKAIDSLLAKGYEMHHFGYGFKILQLKDSTNTGADIKAVSLNYSSLLKQLNQQLPDGFPLWIFADKSPQRFDASLPKLHLHVQWRNSNSVDSIIKHTSQFLGQDYKATATPLAVTYNLKGKKTNPDLNIYVPSGHNPDARYVKSALASIANYRSQKINILSTVSDNTKLDGIFWLSNQSLPSTLKTAVKPDGFVFRYAAGKINNEQSGLTIANQNIHPAVQLFQSTVNEENSGDVWWKDRFGNVILSYQKGKPSTFIFYSKLLPQWTDLVWKENFVKELIPILYQQSPHQFGFDETNSLTPFAKEPIALFQSDGHHASQTLPNQPLDKLIWVAAFLVLCIERFLTFRYTSKFKQASHGR